MAPEVMCRQNHGIAADYFAVELLYMNLWLGEGLIKGRLEKKLETKF